MTLTAPSPTRSPLAVRLSAVVLVLLVGASTLGLLLHTFVWDQAALGAGTVFVAFMLATSASVLAAVPSLVRGEVTGWAVCFLWSSCYTYWSVYKVFGEEEFESVGFLAAGAALVAMLASRTARAYAGIAR